MGIIQLPKNWSMKPPPGAQINPAHPLARGLVRAYIFNEGGGCPNDLVRGRAAAGIGSNNVWVPGPNGPVIKCAHATGSYVSDPDAYVQSALTVVIKVLWDGTAHASDYFWLWNHWWAVYINSPPGSAYLNFVRNWTTSYDGIGFNYFPDTSKANQWFHFTWVSPGIPNGHLLYVNGAQPYTGGISGSGTVSDVTEFTIGAYDGANSQAGPWAGLIDHCLVYDRALTAAEVRMLYADNFCFMQPQSPK